MRQPNEGRVALQQGTNDGVAGLILVSRCEGVAISHILQKTNISTSSGRSSHVVPRARKALVETFNISRARGGTGILLTQPLTVVVQRLGCADIRHGSDSTLRITLPQDCGR